MLRPTGDVEALAYAETYLGAVQALTDRQEEALTRLLEAQALAARAGRRDLVALCHNYIGCARVDLGDVDAGLEELRRSLRLSLDLPHHEYAARAYTNLAETAYQLHRYDELAAWIDEGAQFAADHDLPGHLHNLEAHRALLLLDQGHWDEAQRPAGTAGRGRVRAGPADPAEPAAARPAAGAARRRPGGRRARPGLGPRGAQREPGRARRRPGWPSSRAPGWPGTSRPPTSRSGCCWSVRRRRRGADPGRAAALPGPGRAGGPELDGCPAEWAAGLAGDWQQAADDWRKIGNPYEQALELAAGPSTAACMEALDLLDGLGAVAAARLVRARLRELGAPRIPGVGCAATRENPAGLTDRQVDVLALLATGLTNAEIAERLVVSTRTVDHHVSAILTRLDVASRRDAARRAAELGLAAEVGSSISV